MPQITHIEFRRRKPQRFIVQFDDDEVHTFSPETALKHGFVLEKEFSDEEFLEIIREDSIRRAKDQVLRYLEVRPHSRRELTLKLLRKSYRKETIDTALTDLEKVDLINDEKFSRQFIENELRPILQRADDTMRTVQSRTAFLSDSAVKPVIEVMSWGAAVRGIIGAFTRPRQ